MSPRQSLTHFLCIPLATPTAAVALGRGLDDLRRDVRAAALPSQGVRPLGTLHLTVGVLALDAEALQRARALLASVAPPAPPLQFGLRGLCAMGGDARATRVLYAPPAGAGAAALQRYCEGVRAVFDAHGLLPPDPAAQSLLLHATLFRAPRRPVDARDLLAAYQDRVWVDDFFAPDQLVLCEMGARPPPGGMPADAEYPVVAALWIGPSVPEPPTPALADKRLQTDE